MHRLFKGLFRGGAGTGDSNLPRVKVGVCAMDKKAHSKPMNEILERLTAWGEFEIVHFGDDVMLNKPTEEWPQVECLLCWHSDGFPLKKAQEYILNRRPFLVNDVFMQVQRVHVHARTRTSRRVHCRGRGVHGKAACADGSPGCA